MSMKRIWLKVYITSLLYCLILSE